MWNREFIFENREEAGKLLAEKIKFSVDLTGESLILAVPSGGVPVGTTMAKLLGMKFDIIAVRKTKFHGILKLATAPSAGTGPCC